MVVVAMLLVADVGGTKTTLAVVADGGVRDLVWCETLPSRGIEDLGALLASVLARGPWTVTACCLGVPGPVIGERSEVTNLPWVIDAHELGTRLGVRVLLLNDLEALAGGIGALRAEDTDLIAAGRPGASGTIAIIAAGTGLGQAGLVWDGNRHVVLPSEGGHTDFAPQSEREIALLRRLLRCWSHGSYERLVSGPGLVRILEFLRDEEGQALPAPLAAALTDGSDGSAAITAAALAGDVPIASAALDLFVMLYGAAAGNLALTLRATGGVYLGGGIAPRILPKLHDGRFHAAFTSKGRFAALLTDMPVRVILDPHVAIYGAARHARAHLD